MTSPPVVVHGVVTFTSYRPGVNGCSGGEASRYAMNYETCSNATATVAPRPVANAAGGSIPMSPLYLRSSDTVLVPTVGGLNGPIAVKGRGVGGGSGRRGPIVPLFWRVDGLW